MTWKNSADRRFRAARVRVAVPVARTQIIRFWRL
jgi:hypothetical protein